jgi:hypothetical protein
LKVGEYDIILVRVANNKLRWAGEWHQIRQSNRPRRVSQAKKPAKYSGPPRRRREKQNYEIWKTEMPMFHHDFNFPLSAIRNPQSALPQLTGNSGRLVESW